MGTFILLFFAGLAVYILIDWLACLGDGKENTPEQEKRIIVLL